MPYNELRNGIFTLRRRISSPMECLHAYARATDEILRKLFTERVVKKGQAEEICLVALGGYGRGEMSPYSDVDIMLLYSDSASADVISAFERGAWDLGLALGFVARTPAECIRILGDDCASDTALLESTFITGSIDLYTRLIGMAIRPFFRRRKKRFLDEMRSALIAGISSKADTLYRIEPDVKNGICCLRDCHRIAWAERVAHESFGGQARPDYQFINKKDHKRLMESYAFLMKVRTELHVLSKRRLDILEVALQHDIALSFGYKDTAPAALMGDFFKAVTTVKQCILVFSEHIYEEQGVLGRLRSAIGSFNVGSGLKVIDGILHLRKHDKRNITSANWAMDVFTTAITCHADIGTGLRNKLREVAHTLLPGNFRTTVIEEKMCTILSGKQQSGRIIQLMHETEILDLILPEFAPLTCRVEFDTYHEYTVDQHTLFALCAMDELIKDREDLVQRVYLRLKNKRVLRLALLMHDTGKALEGDHCRSGAIIARNAAARLGFEKEEQQQVEFLVYHHLDMSELSLRRELEEPAMRQFATTVGSTSMLDMLYLLTVLDIRYVGARSWTGWKAVQLSEIFTLTEKLLCDEDVKNLEKTLKKDFTDYTTSTMPEDRASHQEWLATLQQDDMQIHTESFTGFYRVTIVTFDRVSLLSDIAACFIAAGLHIMSARVHSFPQNKIVDVFDVEPDEVTRLQFSERTERFKNTWKRLSTGKTTSDSIVNNRLKNYPGKPQRQIPIVPQVKVNNTDSQLYTIIEVQAPNRFGLFHTLVSVLCSCNISINAARISTAIDEAVDIFYVSSASGMKIEDAEQLRGLEKAILDRIQ